MSTIKLRIIKSKFIKNIAIVASGTIAAQIINFGLTPVITRIYGPDAFGLLGTFMAVINILGPIAALTFPIAIVLPKSHNKAKQIIKLALVVCLSFGIILSIMLLLAFDIIVALFNLWPIASFLFLIPLVVIFSGILQTIEQWLIRTKQFKVTAKTAVFHSIVVNISKIGAGLLYPFAMSLVLIQTFGIAFRGIMMFILADRSLYFKKEKFKENNDLKNIAFDYRDFPLYRAPQVFFNAISQGLPTILLASYFGPAAAGFYSLGRQALGTPVQILGKAVQDVFYPRVSEALNTKENVSKIIIKSVLGLTILGIIPFGAVIALGPIIFSFVFGGEWEVAGIYAQWIALMSLFMLITRPVIVSVPVLKIQRQFLLFEILGSIFKIGALVFGFYYFQSDIYAVALFSLTSMCLYIALTVYTLWVAKSIDDDR
ncbi:oligosaccharide flippase family protein [Thalassobacillus sp. B23F22_16]|uniref:oligosaccharide flippase family protein n=1 Tax=Thalassobacillus sp. B23F22_16 TaxID=3459513 RepID=UPI00373F38BA